MKYFIATRFIRFVLLFTLSTLNFLSAEAQTYCAKSFSNTFIGIGNVNFAGIDNASSSSYYSDFTSEVATVTLEGSYLMNIYVINSSNAVGRIYIDWNQDGVFNTDESYSYDPRNGTVTITVPEDATLGMTRMRIITTWNSTPNFLDACGGGTYGEAEDYSINVLENLYSIQNGDWATQGTWSREGHSGISCNCIPSVNTTSATIGNGNEVTINSDITVDTDLIIENTGILKYNSNNTTLTLSTGASIQIKNGGQLSDGNKNQTILISNGQINSEHGSQLSIENLYVNGMLTNNGLVDIKKSLLIFSSKNFTNGSLGTVSFASLLTLGSANLINHGTINHSTSFSVSNSCSIINHNGSQWNWSGNTIGSMTNLAAVLDVNSYPNTFEYVGTNSQTIIPVTYDTLSINGVGVKLLYNSTTVNSQLELFQGYVQLGEYDLIIGANASVTGWSTSSFIITDSNGSLQINEIKPENGEVSFPIGTDMNHLSTLSITNNGTADNYKARVFNGVMQGGLNGALETVDVVNKSWEISEETLGGSDVLLAFEWHADEELPGFDRTDFEVNQYSQNSGYWATNEGTTSLEGTGPFKGGNNESVTTFSTYSIFAISNTNTPLPIVLSHFTVEEEDGLIRFNWETLNELNNDYFTIERSLEGSNWNEIKQIKGHGNSNIPIQYTALDKNPFYGTSYYRLKQTDFDGNYEYFEIVQIDLSKSSHTPNIKISPNPAHENIMLSGLLSNENSLKVIDTSGKDFTDLIRVIEKSNNHWNVDVGSLSKGVYFLLIGTDSFKLIKH